MIKNDRPVRDVFAFSLGGITTISSIVAAPAIADDRFDKVPVRRETRPRPWLCFYHQAAYFPCA